MQNSFMGMRAMLMRTVSYNLTDQRSTQKENVHTPPAPYAQKKSNPFHIYMHNTIYILQFQSITFFINLNIMSPATLNGK